MKRTTKDYILLTLKGIAMGAADIVPGVSGGTIAFISGIYQELITSINRINIEAFRIWKNDGLKSFWQYINGNFFVALFSGITLSILTVSKAIKWLLEHQPIGLWSFFFGLMIASVIFLSKDIQKWTLKSFFCLVFFTILAYFITIIPPFSGNNSSFFLFISGAIAICAMILPGISGAFILVLLGSYHNILHAIDTRDFITISFFASGAIFGILSFSKILKWLFTNYKNLTLASLTGFIIGSLNKIWPWKQIVHFEVDTHGKKIILEEHSVLPIHFQGDPELINALFWFFLGFAILYFLEKWASNLKQTENGSNSYI